MLKFEVDREKCTHCGLCIKDCLGKCLEEDSQGVPQMTNKKDCFSCQHCFAICPQGAITFNGKVAADSENVDYNNLLSLIKSRRSIRQYRSNEVPEEKLNLLKQMLPYIPTGCNSHSLHFTIVEKKEAMDIIRKRVGEKILQSLAYKVVSPIVKKFAPYRDALKRGDDIIFYNAPHIIVVSSPVTAPCAAVDPIIALSYIELYAQHLGLGTCWCGYAEICVKVFPEICEMLKIPNGYTPVYVMLLGEPAVQYKRTTQPEQYEINSITEISTGNSDIINKAKRLITNFIR